MIKFLHAADLHLGSAFASLSETAAKQRQSELLETANELVELCNSRGCDLLLLAGDVCETTDAAKSLAKMLAACDAEVIIAPGNHDPYGANGPYNGIAWSDNVTIFDDTEIARIHFPDLHCDVYGAAFLSNTAPALMEGFSVLDPNCTNLMVLHGDTEQADSPYNPISQAQIAASGLDYLALGHIHSYSGSRTAGNTVYAWPGCPAGRGFDETGAKGVILGEANRGAPLQIEFYPLSVRRYEMIDIEVGSEPLADIRAALPPDTAKDIYRITLTGQSEPLDIRSLTSTLQPRFYQLTLRDETVRRIDIWSGLDEDSLRGLFLRRLREQWEATEDPQTRQICELAVRFGLAALDEKEAPHL